MRRKTIFLSLLFLAFISGFLFASLKPFTKKDIQAAQKLIGVHFTKAEIDTMYHYLKENLEAYEQMRNAPLSEDVVPPLLFKTNYKNGALPEHQPIEWVIGKSLFPAEMEDLAFYTLEELAWLIKSRQISSEQLTRFFLERIRKYDHQLQLVVNITEELAMAQATKADKELAAGIYRGPLHGIPYGVKDLFAVRGYPTTWGSSPYKEQVLEYDAAVVEKLEEAGAVLVAKLVSGELARGDVWFGGKTKNPWDLSQGASGSSAGSAAAVSAGLVPFAIGTETLGSIVSPSSRCGVTGLRPTFGRVSRFGCMSLSWSMDKAGPITKTARDAAIVLEAMMGEDGSDRTVEDVILSDPAAIDPRSLRVSYLEGMNEQDTTEAGRNAIRLLTLLSEDGFDLKPARLPEDDIPYKVFDIILRAESGAFFDELVRSKRVDQLVEQHAGSRANSLRQSRFIPAVEYLQANRHRQVLMDKMDDVFEATDVLIVPTFGRQLLITNVTGHPALVIPAGFDDKGRPTSITFVGQLFEEDQLLAFAGFIQGLTDHHRQRPPGFSGFLEPKN